MNEIAGQIDKTVVGYRTIIERSIMSNNDEMALYSQSEIDENEVRARGAKIVFTRPFVQEEVNLGLDVRSSKMEAPPLTRWLDAYCRLVYGLRMPQDLIVGAESPSVSKRLAYMIGSQFYDCMSGGMDSYVVMFTYHLCKQDRVDKTEQTYPKSGSDNGWLTIADFINEVEKSRTWMDKMKEAPEQFSIALQLMTLLDTKKTSGGFSISML